MIYTNTQQILKHIRHVMLTDDITMKELATSMSKTAGAVSSQFKQQNITLESLNSICSALGYDLEINFIKKTEED